MSEAFGVRRRLSGAGRPLSRSLCGRRPASAGPRAQGRRSEGCLR